jgi:hypothetical protein
VQPLADNFPTSVEALANLATDGEALPERRARATAALATIANDSGPPDREPALAALARIAVDVTAPPPCRQRAIEALEPFIRRAARRIAHRFGGQIANDLPDDALAYVYARLSQFQTGAFEAWCWVVLRNRVLGQLLRESNERRRKQQAAEQRRRAEESRIQDAVRQQRAATPSTDEHSLMAEADLTAVEGWRPEQRLALLGRAGLWPRVPSDRQAAWVEAYVQARGIAIDATALRNTFTDYSEAPANNAVAYVLGVTPGKVATWWKRWKHLLEELDYVRRLRPDV